MGAWNALQRADLLFLRTAMHPTVRHLTSNGIVFETFDHLYDRKESFELLYAKIADQLLSAASVQPVTYAVPGHPLVGEESVRLILQAAEERDIPVELIPSMSALDAIFAATGLDPIAGLQVYDALSFTPNQLIAGRPAVFLQVYNSFVASELKLDLLQVLDADTPVVILQAVGIPGEEHLCEMPLKLIDHQPFDHLSSLLIPVVETEKHSISSHSLDPLVEVMQRLLAPDGCPWDRKQTHDSLGRFLIEEAYEVIDAVAQKDYDALCEELGDVLLQIVFHSLLASQCGAFDIDDVVHTVTAKMKRRHPHVFGTVEADDEQAVLRNWEAIKRMEKAIRGDSASEDKSLLSGIPRQLPALMLAEKTQKKAAQVGFEWDSVAGAWAKLEEELQELTAAMATGTDEARTHELGDVLFALVNVARYLKIDPEDALRKTTDKFMRRFHYIEQSAARKGQTLSEMTLSEMDEYWDEAKKLEGRSNRTEHR